MSQLDCPFPNEQVHNLSLEAQLSIPFSELKRQILSEEGATQNEGNGGKSQEASLLQYCVEAKHVPLGKYLSSSSKFVSTRDWMLARDECKIIQAFDRILELKNASAWFGSAFLEIPDYPVTPRTTWDNVLNELWFMARDFEAERRWKRFIALKIAQEAQSYLANRKNSKLLSSPGGSTKFTYTLNKEILLEMKGKVASPYSTNSLIPISKAWPLEQSSVTCISDEKDEGIPEIIMIDDSFREDQQEKGQDQNEVEKVLEQNDTSSNEDNSNTDNNLQINKTRPLVHRLKLLHWSVEEEEMLISLAKSFGSGNPSCLLTITTIINVTFHDGRRVRLPQDVLDRLEAVRVRGEQDENGSATTTRVSFKIHLERMNLMNSSNTRLTNSRPTTIPKKINMVAHPSHEAAARKANQNISKLLTPQELALRRIQRTRILTDPSGAILSIPAGVGIPSLNRSNLNPPPTATNIPSVPGTPNNNLPAPPPSTQRPPVNVAVYQAAVAAASSAPNNNNIQSQPQPQQQPFIRPPIQPNVRAINSPPTTSSAPTAQAPPSIPQSNLSNANTAAQQQRRQDLLNRSQQINSYMSTMQVNPTQPPFRAPPISTSSQIPSASPLLRPPITPAQPLRNQPSIKPTNHSSVSPINSAVNTPSAMTTRRQSAAKAAALGSSSKSVSSPSPDSTSSNTNTPTAKTLRRPSRHNN